MAKKRSPEKTMYFTEPGDKLTESVRQRFEVLRSQLETERSSFLSHWRDLADYILPRRPRFWVTDVDRGERRNLKIIDSTATLAARTLRSGMMSGITSPARPWFRLSTADPDLDQFASVKQWLYFVNQRMEAVFGRSNLYNVLPIIYGDMGVFATSAMIVEEDFDQVIRSYPFAIGSYCIANNARLKVNVFQRVFRLTVRQVVEKFGQKDPHTGAVDWSNISGYVKNLWDQGMYEVWVDIYHFIVPNDEYDSRKLGARFKRFKSVYFESGASSSASTGGYTATEPPTKLLRESGYDYFPVLCPRWEVNGEDVYGTSCPGMDALGDIKGLQVKQKRKAEAIEKMVRPPMKGPTSLRTVKVSTLPGDVTYVDERDGQKGFTPVFEVDPKVQELLVDIQDTRDIVRRSFFEDLFLMLSESDRREITAREVDERHDEKLLALGPVLEQLNQDLLDPLIDITFRMMVRQRLIPPPPQEMRGVNLRVEYISIMAEAQKLIGIEGIERFAGFVGNVAKVDPNVLDVVDSDEMVSRYGDMTSVPPGIIRSADQIAAIRKQKQQAQAAQAQAEAMQQKADTAQTLSQTDTEGPNALTDLIDQAQAGNVAPTR